MSKVSCCNIIYDRWKKKKEKKSSFLEKREMMKNVIFRQVGALQYSQDQCED